MYKKIKTKVLSGFFWSNYSEVFSFLGIFYLPFTLKLKLYRKFRNLFFPGWFSSWYIQNDYLESKSNVDDEGSTPIKKWMEKGMALDMCIFKEDIKG